jgi:hypothetical protein
MTKKIKQQQLLSSLGRLKVLAVGVSEYIGGGFKNLKKCDTDAEYVLSSFQDIKQLNADASHMVLINSSTKARLPMRGIVLAHLKELAAAAEPNDRILFYFSGHGHRFSNIEDNYLVPYDVYSDSDPNAMISMNQVREILNSSEAKQKMIVLDACMSGPTGLGSKNQAAKYSDKFFADTLANTKGFAIISSSAADEKSYMESPNPKLSLFTHYLVSGLRGAVDALDKEKILTVGSLHGYVTAEVKRRAHTYKVTQTPSLHTSSTNPIVLGDFRKQPAWEESVKLDRSKIHSITLRDSYPEKVRAILTAWGNRPKTQAQLQYAANTPAALEEYLDADFSSWRTELRKKFNFASAQIEADGGELSFPGGSLFHEYKAETKESGAMHRELYLDEDWFDDVQRIQDLLDIFGVAPEELSISLVKKIAPIDKMPTLAAYSWEVLREKGTRVVAQKGAVGVTICEETLTFTGLDFDDLFGPEEEESASRSAFVQALEASLSSG